MWLNPSILIDIETVWGPDNTWIDVAASVLWGKFPGGWSVNDLSTGLSGGQAGSAVEDNRRLYMPWSRLGIKVALKTDWHISGSYFFCSQSSGKSR